MTPRIVALLHRIGSHIPSHVNDLIPLHDHEIALAEAAIRNTEVHGARHHDQPWVAAMAHSSPHGTRLAPHPPRQALEGPTFSKPFMSYRPRCRLGLMKLCSGRAVGAGRRYGARTWLQSLDMPGAAGRVLALPLVMGRHSCTRGMWHRRLPLIRVPRRLSFQGGRTMRSLGTHRGRAHRVRPPGRPYRAGCGRSRRSSGWQVLLERKHTYGSHDLPGKSGRAGAGGCVAVGEELSKLLRCDACICMYGNMCAGAFTHHRYRCRGRVPRV